jgi:hypothetical protein
MGFRNLLEEDLEEEKETHSCFFSASRRIEFNSRKHEKNYQGWVSLVANLGSNVFV